MKANVVVPQFVAAFPKPILEGVLYIALDDNLAAHLCCCGCRTKIVTKLSRVDWVLTSSAPGIVTLNPSIGNWNHPCQSHYFIRNNRVIWVGKMSARQVARGRAKSQAGRDQYYGVSGIISEPTPTLDPAPLCSESSCPPEPLLERLLRWLAR